MRVKGWGDDPDIKSMWRVGAPFGMDYRPAGEAGDAEGALRYAGKMWHFAPIAYELWKRIGTARDMGELEAWAAEWDIEDLPETLQTMEKEGMVVCLSGDFGKDRVPLATHRLMPVGLGAGNSAESREEYVIEIAGHAPLRVSPLCYTIWSYCDGIRSMDLVVALVAGKLELTDAVAYQYLTAELETLLWHSALLLDLIGPTTL